MCIPVAPSLHCDQPYIPHPASARKSSYFVGMTSLVEVNGPEKADDSKPITVNSCVTFGCTGELGYDGPLYDGFWHMTDDMLGPSPMHIKYSSYVYDGFCI